MSRVVQNVVFAHLSVFDHWPGQEMVPWLQAYWQHFSNQATSVTLHIASGQTQVKKSKPYAPLGECKACSGMMLWLLWWSSMIHEYSVIFNTPCIIRSDCRWVPRWSAQIRLESQTWDRTHVKFGGHDFAILRFRHEVLYSYCTPLCDFKLWKNRFLALQLGVFVASDFFSGTWSAGEACVAPMVGLRT